MVAYLRRHFVVASSIQCNQSRANWAVGVQCNELFYFIYLNQVIPFAERAAICISCNMKNFIYIYVQKPAVFKCTTNAYECCSYWQWIAPIKLDFSSIWIWAVDNKFSYHFLSQPFDIGFIQSKKKMRNTFWHQTVSQLHASAQL